MQKKKGVSLIVLIITIIVMIILATTVMLSLENTGILDKANEAVNKSDLQEIQHIATLKWAELYGTESDDVIESEIIRTLDSAGVKTSEYSINITDNGVEVIPVLSWVVTTVDGVPIPKGFVASRATGENTKEGGLVIYEGTLPVTDENVDDAKRERNQYVWVPVDDFSKFVRQNFGQSNTISNAVTSDYWEVTPNNASATTEYTNPDYAACMDAEKISTSEECIEAYGEPTFKISQKTIDEVTEMYESVERYGGFYIARYEAGLDVGSHKNEADETLIKTVHFKMNKAPYNYIKWGEGLSDDTNGAVEIARSIYSKANSNYGVVSTLTYGVQWDSVLEWWMKTNAKNGTGDATITSDTLNTSTNYGNYYDNAIALNNFNEGAKYLLYTSSTLATEYQDVKARTYYADWLMTTGATEETRINNIYDMAGNLFEWTMEGYGARKRILRGGSFNTTGSSRPVDWREQGTLTSGYAYRGFRSALYIKY